MTDYKDFVLQVEILNFVETMGDVRDLSTLRGGSRAALLAPKVVAKKFADRVSVNGAFEELWTGASIGRFKISVDPSRYRDHDIQALLEKRDWLFASLKTQPEETSGEAETVEDFVNRILPHLTIGLAVEPDVSNQCWLTTRRALDRAIKGRQFKRPTVDPALGGNAEKYCPYDGVRPCTSKVHTPKEKADEASLSVAARRRYGQKLRQAFYEQELGRSVVPDRKFSDNFEEIAESTPKGIKLPLSVQGKIAVLYLDGNKFTATREKAIRESNVPLATEKDFAENVKTAQRGLLRAVLKKVCALQPEGVIPFETLLWGGDEYMFVFPAWMAFPVLETLADALRDEAWSEIAGGQKQPLTHAVGLAIAHYKTPIRQLTEIARHIADEGKKALGNQSANVIQMEIFESESATAGKSAITAHRKELFKGVEEKDFTFLLGEAGEDKQGLPSLLDLADRVHALAAGESGKDEASPNGGEPIARSQLYHLIRHLEQEAQATKIDQEKLREALGLEGDLLWDQFEDRGGRRRVLISFAELWDYVPDYGPETSCDASPQSSSEES
ncbi:Cas10/Cmr2 second palm domain-containing protein [Yunchengibacter salinarum]|uniref:Cas10/Cmr2 second palm domain-containing protein n=1 Tax=Yunchengibacter salinarum TaxID=3133399 RepID=UPI0035B5EDFB